MTLDTYNLFIEKGLNLLVKDGILGFIIPSAWVASKYDDKFRKFISEKSRIEKFVISHKRTFTEATVETCVIILSNCSPESSFIVERWDQEPNTSYSVNINQINNGNNYIFPVYSDESVRKLIEKIKGTEIRLQEIAEVIWGVKVYEKSKGIPPQRGDESINKIFHSEKRTKPSHRPLIGGKEINRYLLNWNKDFIDYGKWLAAPRNPTWFDGERIVVREVTAKGIIQATYIQDDFVFSNSVDGIRMKSNTFNIKVLLAILNSKLISFYNLNTSANAFKGSFPKVLVQDLRELPIPKIKDDQIKQLENHCNQLLTLYKNRQEVKLQGAQEQIQNQINYFENKINEIVYQQYNLTQIEIEIIERSL